MRRYRLLVSARLIGWLSSVLLNARHVSVFGSFIRGSKGPGDIDLVISGCDENRFLRSFLKMFAAFLSVDVNYALHSIGYVEYVVYGRAFVFLPVLARDIKQVAA